MFLHDKTKKTVTMLSTMHHEVAVDDREGNDRKPVMVFDYNATKGAVDSCDERVNLFMLSKNQPMAIENIFQLYRPHNLECVYSMAYHASRRVQRQTAGTSSLHK